MSHVSREIHTRRCYCTVFTILSVVIVTLRCVAMAEKKLLKTPITDVRKLSEMLISVTAIL